MNKIPNDRLRSFKSRGRERLFYILAIVFVIYISLKQSSTVASLKPTKIAPGACNRNDITTNSCTGKLPDISTRYTNYNTKLGGGFQAQVNLLTSKTDDHTEYVGIFGRCKEGLDDAIAKTIELGKLCRGAPHLMQLHDVVCNQGQQIPVFEKCTGVKLRSLQPQGGGCFNMKGADIHVLMRQAVEVVQFMMTASSTTTDDDNDKNKITKQGFWHADFHPGNFIYNTTTQNLCVVDYGMGQFIPTWFNNNNQQQPEKRIEAERYQYNRTIFPQPEGIPVLHRDDFLGFAKSLLYILNVTIPIPDNIATDDSIRNPTTTTELSFERWVRLQGRRKFLQYIKQYNLELPYDYFKESGLKFDSIPEEGIDDYKQLVNECNKSVLNKNMFAFIKGVTQFSYFDRLSVFESTVKLIKNNQAFPFPV